MKILIQFIILLTISLPCMGNNYKPKKANNSDLRSNSIIASITERLNEKTNTLTLQKSAANHYFIAMKSKKEEPFYKISYKSAQEIDEKFVSVFIDVKYMSQSFSGKNCSIFYSLSMRGETTNICKTEKEKIKKIDKIVFMMKKYFK
jgi:hypothetical protein